MAPFLLNSNLQAFNLAVSSLLKNPSLLLPNFTISTFLELPEQLGPHLVSSTSTTSITSSTKEQAAREDEGRRTSVPTPNIRALILDKDNTLCLPKTTVFPPAYLQKLTDLRTSPTSPFNLHTNPDGILIVSNTAGSRPNVPAYEAEASDLERQLAHLNIQVFRVRKAEEAQGQGNEQGYRRKPFCGKDVLAWLYERKVINGPDEVAVVGDRLGTDVLMASAEMGSWSVWCRDGIVTHTHTHGRIDSNENKDYRGFMAKMEVVMERYLRESRGVKPAVPERWRNQSSN